MPRLHLAPVFAVTLVLTLSSLTEGGGPSGHIPGEYRFFADDIVLIRAPEDESVRVLLSFPELDSLQGHEVHIARLILPPMSATSGFTIQAHRVTTDWDSSTVGWSTPWQSAGGDYDEASHAGFRVHAGRSEEAPIWLNVSRQVHEIVDDSERNYGFIITPPQYERLGFTSESASYFSALDSACLIVVCGD